MSNSESIESATLSKEETDALNKHGVFFKKRVLQELSSCFGIGIVAEELGVSFGQTRVIDIVAQDDRDKPHVVFVFECKRAYTTERKWIFFRDYYQRYRICRTAGGLFGSASMFASSNPPHPPVCSEGYELKKKNSITSADQNPVFQAAAQLSAGYLGLVGRRERELNRPGAAPSDVIERFVPVLVTNAELLIVDSDTSAISLETGNISAPPKARSSQFLILKHPFPTPEGMAQDLRDDPNPPPPLKDWNQLHTESIYVVHSSALKKFMSMEHRDYLRSAKSED